MKKVGGKVLLCLSLCLTLLLSSITVFATEDNQESRGNDTTSVTHGLDLSKFESKPISEVGGIYDGMFYLMNGYSYYILYYSGTDFYTFVVSDDEPSKYVKLTVDEANELISNSENYNPFQRDGKYYCVGDVSSLDGSEYTSMHIFMYDEASKKFSNLGFYDNVASIEKYAKLDLSEKVDFNVSVVNVTDTSATINVKYASNTELCTLVCYMEEFDADLYVEDVQDNARLNGEYNFKVNSNGEYTIKAYYSPYIIKEANHAEYKVNVTGITGKKLDETVDDKAPVVTFSTLPEAVTNGNVTEITMYSDEPAILNFNGVSSNGYVTEMKVKVKFNSDYKYSATDIYTNCTEDTLKVNFFSDPKVMSDETRDEYWGDPIANTLPQTGGTDYKVYLLIGGCLVAGGAGFFVVSRKKKSNKTEK